EPFRAHALEDHPWREWAEAEETTHRMPGGQSRWTGGKDLSWDPVRLELVAEVAFEHVQRVGGAASHEGRRLPHTAPLLGAPPRADPRLGHLGPARRPRPRRVPRSLRHLTHTHLARFGAFQNASSRYTGVFESVLDGPAAPRRRTNGNVGASPRFFLTGPS